LIGAAAELCVKQGYDNTTVEQIAAAAADVSPRTFSRYFPTKESVVAAVADEMDTMAVMIQIVNGSASIKASALSQQRALSENASTTVIARRLGVAPGDAAVTMVADMWTVLFATSFAGLGQPGDDPNEANIVCDRLCAAVELFRRSWSPSNAHRHARQNAIRGQPPQARKSDSDYLPLVTDSFVPVDNRRRG
jgi:AcrR family transcriptional regulator